MIDDVLRQLISAERIANLGPERSTKFGPGRDWVIGGRPCDEAIDPAQSDRDLRRLT